MPWLDTCLAFVGHQQVVLASALLGGRAVRVLANTAINDFMDLLDAGSAGSGRWAMRAARALIEHASLRALEEAGLAHRALAGSTVAYHLTPSGQELGDIIVALDRWGSRRLPDQPADNPGPSNGDATIPGARGEPTQETP